ncbi:hypothetical protein CALVIDRAFT_538718 [Calocera viscosa TUFC12733]|uniref:Peroxisomal membrane protein PEX13 n=1 Tax=Calocera viscosa (strain TUFC12733) TaxID=1330018 RepID=A0A167KFL2_CALVF|nr:hypothetical protein CALVIDRAFT_538718 [Calocera viscosa TUFC12733]
MAAPPKPWERQTQLAPSPAPASTPMAPSMTSETSTLVDSAPSLPTRPSSITAPASQAIATTSALAQPLASAYGQPYSAYGSSYAAPAPYSSPYSSFASPYSRFGGGYGGGYGGYGGGYGGYGGNPYNPMLPGQPGYDPNNPSLTQRMEASTSQTFQLLSSLVQTFGSFAQMLESTYMATHSSFFAMIGVADQFANLRKYLGEVLGVFSLLAWLRGLWRGERTASGLSSDFRAFLKGATGPDGRPSPRPSRKPLVIFLLAAFGLPYMMHKLINMLSKRQPLPPIPDGQNALAQGQEILDPSTLTFARSLYPFDTTDPVELPLRKNEIVAVLSKLDPVTGVEGEWWRGRTREGRTGWFPRKWVEIIKKGTDEPAEPKTTA